jgi:hypothetical protein
LHARQVNVDARSGRHASAGRLTTTRRACKLAAQSPALAQTTSSEQ